jgi:hypothetical protein
MQIPGGVAGGSFQNPETIQVVRKLVKMILQLENEAGEN